MLRESRQGIKTPMRTHNLLLAALLGLILLTTRAQADEVLFKNGDRLNGTIESYDGSKLTISSTVAGKVTVELKDVRTFSTTHAIDVTLADGTTVRAPVAGGPDGQVSIVPAAGPPRAVALADISKVNMPVKWTGNIVVGGLIARGNTNTDSFNATAHAERRTVQDRIILDGGYLFGREHTAGIPGKHETADDLFGSGEYDYFLTKKLYALANVRAEHDTIAGLSLRLTPNVGLGYQWIETPKLNFNTEAGAGWIYRKYSHDGEDSSATARLAYHLAVKFNDRVSGLHNFEYLPGLDRLDDYFIHTDAGIRASVTEKMFTEFKVDYRYDSKPAPGKGASDIRYILGVGWSF